MLHKTTTTAFPMQITPDVWILTTPATAPINTITLDMPRECHANNRSLTTTTCTETAYSLQCHFSSFLPTPRYETPVLNVNVSLDMANLQTVNITTLHFCVWQHLGNNHSDTQLQHLATIPSIPVHKVYQHLFNDTLQLTSFNTEPSEDMDTLWSLFTHL